jgi:streptomycin 6-kinase
MRVPVRVEANAQRREAGRIWLAHLPELVNRLRERWQLTLDPSAPFDGDEGSCAWVAPCQRADGSAAVLKVTLPHFEAEHEIEGLRFWAGEAMVRLLEADAPRGAFLVERCVPGTPLRARLESEQDSIIAGLLRRLWRSPAPARPFRALSAMVLQWSAEAQVLPSPHSALIAEGVAAMSELAAARSDETLLATDLHAGNVLAAKREPWLVIDPKPFIGDRAYDATQHLLNCRARLIADARATVTRFADLLEVDAERVRGWLFARLALDADTELASLLSKGSY